MAGDEHLLAHGAVAPVRKLRHLLHKLLIHNDFGGIPGRPALQELNAHQVVETVGAIILVGNVEQFPVIVRKIDIVTVGALERKVVGRCHATHFRQALQRADGTGDGLAVTVEEADIVEVIVIVTGIGMGDLLILPADDEHHHHQEHVDQHLHAQEAEFPAPGVLRVVLQGGIDRDPLVQLRRDDDGDDEDKYKYGDYCHDTLRNQQRCKGDTQQVFHDAPAGENDDRSHAQREYDMQQRFLRQHSVNVLSLSAIALAYAHFLGALHQGGDHNQDVVQQGDQDQERRHNGQQDHLGLHLRIGRVHLGEGLQEIAEGRALGLDLLQRLMRLLHLADGIGKCARVNAGEQFHIALVPVVPVPVVGALLAVGVHRQEDVVIQRPVLREVLEHALDGQLQPGHVLVVDLLADDGGQILRFAQDDRVVILREHFVILRERSDRRICQLLGKRPRNHHTPPLPQRLHRITGQDGPVEHLEEASIGTDERGFEFIAVLVQVGVPVENEGGAGTGLDARDLFHEAHRHGAAHLAIVLLVPLHRNPGVDGIYPVDVLVETVVTQFEEHLGNEHDTHRQPHTQGQDFDPNIAFCLHLTLSSILWPDWSSRP